MSKAQFFSRAGYRRQLGRQRNILASLHRQHTRSSAPINRGGLYSSIWSLPRSLVLRSTRPSSDDAGPHVRKAVANSGVCATFQMHDAPLVRHLEAPTLNSTRKAAVHIRSSAQIDGGGLDYSIRSLPGSVVLRSTQPNIDDAGPHVRAADGDSGVCTAFPMHDAPVVQRLEAPTLNYTRKTALGHVFLRASPKL
ncbi:hypothetical protein MRX96_050035 [Rhipicephalus microplus]